MNRKFKRISFVNVFTDTFDQFNVSLLNKIIYLFILVFKILPKLLYDNVSQFTQKY